MTEFVITVSPLLNVWAVSGTGRFKPGVYVTEDEALVKTAEAVRFGVSVRPVLPGEEIVEGPYADDPTLTRGALHQADMKGGNNPRQRPSQEAEVRAAEKEYDYSKDPAMDPDYVPHSQRGEASEEETADEAAKSDEGQAVDDAEATEEPSTVASFESDQIGDGVPV